MTARRGSIDKYQQEGNDEQSPEKRVAVFRPELRRNKELERFRVSAKNGNALAFGPEASITDF